MKYEDVRALINRHPELDSEVLDVDNLREYLIYGNDGQKVIAKPTGEFTHVRNDVYSDHMHCFVGQDHIEIPIDEIRSMELVVKFDDLPNKCFIINPTNAIENVFGQNDPNYYMPVSIVKLGVKGYFESTRVVKSEVELMALNSEFNMTPFREVMDIMLDQSMFNADADHIIKHKYDDKLRLSKSEREAI